MSETQVNIHVDKSVIRYNGLVLPVRMRPFFDAEFLNPGGILEISLIHENSGIKYSSCIRRANNLDENQISPTRIYWDEALSDLIEYLILDGNDVLILKFIKFTLVKNKYYINIGRSDLQSGNDQFKRLISNHEDPVLPKIINNSQENIVEHPLAKPDTVAGSHFKQTIYEACEPEINGNRIKMEYEKILCQNKLSHKYKLYAKVLTKQFPRGINLNNQLQVVRCMVAFKKAFFENYNEEWTGDYDQFIKDIIEITVACDDTTMLSITSLNISDSLLNEIIVHVNNLFESGEAIVSSDELYIKFKQRLLQTNIYNSTTLENVVRYYIGGKYNFTDGYICSQELSSIDGYIFDKVLAALLKFSGPMSYEELIRTLPHFPDEKIRDCLKSSSKVIRGKKGYYTHIDCFDITLQDKELLLTTINDNMQDNVITTAGLFDAYLAINPDFFDRNFITDIVSLSDIFKYCYPSKYTHKRGQIIFGDGLILSSTEKVVRHLMSMKSFTYHDMDEYKNSNHYNVDCRGVLKPILKKYFRLDENRFISIDQIIISENVLNGIENLLMDELKMGYVCSANIKNYLSYPYIGSNPCTPYLLESIIRIYGSKFRCPLKLIEYYTGCKKPRGIIVILDSDFTTYEDVLIDVLKKQNSREPFENQMKAIEYLKERNYMQTALRDGFSSIYSKAIAKYDFFGI
ncbi:hypothetical protein [Methanoplanus endosymbiosus]|uniref:Uncharacterized protein n=1 Tax=Methanoplanus endosymbiosus TaxID=33865 RepID=A0A9E7PMJ4_9EURY|nr:hypothetical protein [Methanoplanus endosymbiosus]UUX91401.1 hypothetical protein L6E24_08405 [Methanoplanus endosymbiosus]